MRRIIMLLFLGVIIFSCGSRKRSVSKRASKTKTEHVVTGKSREKVVAEKDEKYVPVVINSTQEYINHFSEIAQDEMRLYAIPASITLAQGILESNSGRGRLSVEANNHFGIKCHDWTGAKIYHDDDASQECFRKYNDAKYSYRDHSLFLTTRKRYSKLFALDIDDYKRWAKELKAAGYATDRKYPDKLISLIHRYNLDKFDIEVLKANKNYRIKERNQSQTYVVVKGDTLYSISKRYNLTVQQLQNLNRLTGTEISIGQELVVSSN